MKIKDLSAPVTVAKTDWLCRKSWIGFTPAKDTLESRNKCENSINKLISNGYIIEYVTKKFRNPNRKFLDERQYLHARMFHKCNAGRFIAVHKLNPVSEKLSNILSCKEYRALQNIWSQEGKKYRWSVAFRVVESYEIVGKPLAEDILGTDIYRRLFQHASKSLRLIDDEVRKPLGELTLNMQACSTDIWQMIAKDIDDKATQPMKVAKHLHQMIDRDLALLALEGHSNERLTMIRKRSRLLLADFLRQREKENSFQCDCCGFDPSDLSKKLKVSKRSFFDIHHKDPLAEGVRLTSINDFALLCPTCHRIEHIKLRT